MRPIQSTLILAACALTLFAPDHLPADWGAGCLPAVAGIAFAQPSMPAADAPEYKWLPVDDEQLALYNHGQQIGNFRIADGLYFTRLPGGGFESEASEPPVPSPIAARPKKCGCCKGCACRAKKCDCGGGKKCNRDCKCVRVIGGEDGADPHPGGVVMDHISETERVTINGEEVTKAQAKEELKESTPVGGPEKPDTTIPDDSKKNSLSIMGGTAAQRQKALADLAAPAFAAWRADVLLQEYPADSPMLKCGFKVSAEQPTIYFQKSDGVVLARVDHYDGPQTWEAVRKTDPNYDASKDPDPTKPKPAPPLPPAPAPNDSGVSGGAIALAVGGLLCFGVFAVGCIVGLVLLVRWLAKPEPA